MQLWDRILYVARATFLRFVSKNGHFRFSERKFTRPSGQGKKPLFEPHKATFHASKSHFLSRVWAAFLSALASVSDDSINCINDSPAAIDPAASTYAMHPRASTNSIN